MKQFLRKLITTGPSHYTPRNTPQRTENRFSNTCTHIHGSIVHKSPKVEMTPTSIKGWMNTSTALYPVNRIFLSHNKGSSTKTGYNVDTPQIFYENMK